MRKAALHNLGCKVNAYETEAMQELLEENGYEIVSFKEYADVYIVNTCTVTNMADRKSRQMLHKTKKINPNAIVVAAGCYVQVQENADALVEDVDILIGNNQKNHLIRLLEEYQKERGANITSLIDINETDEFEELQVSKTADHTRAYLKIQDGCNQFCAYCIIPYARGRVRSRKREEIFQEIESLVANGYKEIVLTGIHLSSYGVDTDDSLLGVIEGIQEVEGIDRIRLGSLEPRIITEDFVSALAKLDKVCPHFHLSLQSGCDETLKRMNRRYDTEEYANSCKLLRTYYEFPMITTDIIVGFPGETEEEFAQTKEFVHEIRFFETHIFKYSPRKGTKAATMENQVEEVIKTKRSNELQELHELQQRNYMEEFQGREVSILIEEQGLVNGEEVMIGHTMEYVKVAVYGKKYKKNQVAEEIIGKSAQIVHCNL